MCIRDSHLPLTEMLEKEANLTDEDLRERVIAAARDIYQGKVDQVGTESWSQFERSIMLQAIDTHWREHLSALDYLRQGIHLRGYAQKNPKQEYKREAFELFSGKMCIRDSSTACPRRNSNCWTPTPSCAWCRTA